MHRTLKGRSVIGDKFQIVKAISSIINDSPLHVKLSHAMYKNQPSWKILFSVSKRGYQY